MRKKKRKKRTKADIRRARSMEKYWLGKRKPRRKYTLTIMARAVLTDDPLEGKNCRVKMRQDELPPMNDCEKLLFEIIVRYPGVASQVGFNLTRLFSENLARTLGYYSLD